MQAPPNQPRALHFGIFEMDLECGELRKNGNKLKLSGHPFLMLAMIAEGNGRVITYQELQKKFWPQITIEDPKHSLGNSLSKARKTLGDSAQEPRYIQTVSKGYRFLVPVTVIEQVYGNHNGTNSQRSDFSLKVKEMWQELLKAPPLRSLLYLLDRCETLGKQHPQHPILPDLQKLIFDTRWAIRTCITRDPNCTNCPITFETSALVFKDPDAISTPVADGWNTLGRVSESVLLMVEHTGYQEDESQAIRIKAARRATPRERRRYERRSK